jgi:type VI secretion system secreted protein Hcp
MASVDYFLKIDGIDGESLDKVHTKEIDVLSWSWSESNSGSSAYGGGGGAGKVSMSDFSFTMHTCKASPKLFLACANGQAIDSAILTCRKAGKTQQEYLKITFSDLLISSYSVGGSSGEVVPVESISFNFSKIIHSYAAQKADGTLEAPLPLTYDLKQNVGT